MLDASQRCIADVKSVLQSIAGLSGKVLQIYNEEDLLDKTKGLVLPAGGVIYEGMRSIPEAGSTSKQGISAELVISLIVLESYSNISAADTKKPAEQVLDAIRNQMMGRRSPTGHLWRFVVEASATPKSGTVLWVQRWSTPVQLTGTIAR